MTEPRYKLAGALIGLARSTEGNEYLIDGNTLDVFRRSLLAMARPVDTGTIKELQPYIERERIKLAPGCHICVSKCGKTDPFDMQRLNDEPCEIKSLKLQLLEAVIATAKEREPESEAWEGIIKSLIMIGIEGYGESTLKEALEKLK